MLVQFVVEREGLMATAAAVLSFIIVFVRLFLLLIWFIGSLLPGYLAYRFPCMCRYKDRALFRCPGIITSSARALQRLSRMSIVLLNLPLQ